jgi:zinc D-Ala-D-Ala carboxypeptidase
MTHRASARITTRRTLRSVAVGLVVVSVAAIGILMSRSASLTVRSLGAGPLVGAPPLALPAASSPVVGSRDDVPATDGPGPAADDGAVGKEDGVLPDGVTVFDAAYPGLADLDPDLLRALQRAGRDAAHDGVPLYVTSGWRSRDYQEELLREAVAEYGSRARAARWVASPDTSPHVSGDAVDIGSADAMSWLSRHGARYGLCPIYRNEPWHYELRPTAIRSRCPRMYADPTQDPRMHG